MSDADTPIVGRARVAHAFGVSASTLKRWANDAEMEQRYRLRDFTFRLGGRVASTERLRAQFLDHVAAIDPRESVRQHVAHVATEIRKRASR